jgi:hypothetical protein
LKESQNPFRARVCSGLVCLGMEHLVDDCHLSGYTGPRVFAQTGPFVFTQTGPPVFAKSGPLVFGQTGP